MKYALRVLLVVASGLAGQVAARAPLSDPVALNIGISCQWQQRCMKAQTKAMKRSLKYVNQSALPLWRVQMCNRNAGRDSQRVDWIGFDNCIRNSDLRPIPAHLIRPTKSAKLPARPVKTRARPVHKPAPKLTESTPASPPTAPGERG